MPFGYVGSVRGSEKDWSGKLQMMQVRLFREMLWMIDVFQVVDFGDGCCGCDIKMYSMVGLCRSKK